MIWEGLWQWSCFLFAHLFCFWAAGCCHVCSWWLYCSWLFPYCCTSFCAFVVVVVVIVCLILCLLVWFLFVLFTCLFVVCLLFLLFLCLFLILSVSCCCWWLPTHREALSIYKATLEAKRRHELFACSLMGFVSMIQKNNNHENWWQQIHCDLDIQYT